MGNVCSFVGLGSDDARFKGRSDARTLARRRQGDSGDPATLDSNAGDFCAKRGLQSTPLLEECTLEAALETLDASANMAVTIFNAGLQGDHASVDPEVVRHAAEVLRRIRRQTGVLERSLLRRTWRGDGADGDQWIDMHMGIRRRFTSIASIAKKVQLESRIVKHWQHYTNMSKRSGPSPNLIVETPMVTLNIDAWRGIDVFKIDKETNQPLTHVFTAIFNTRGLDALCKTKPSKIMEYMRAVEGKYLENPYHNRMHGADVTCAAFYLWSQVEKDPNMKGYFTSIDLLALTFSAAIHDVAHPAVTNDFLVKTHNSLALRYNDKSVLENMHLATSFQLMRDMDFNLLDHNCPSPPSASLRSRVIEMVLATDMVLHKSLIESFASALDFCDDRVQDLDKLVFEKLLLHVADIGHPLRTRAIHREWSARCTEEFLAQGDREKELGLQPMALFDREKAPPLAKGQVGFLNFVVKPCWTTLCRALGQAAEMPSSCFDSNLRMWEDEEKNGELSANTPAGRKSFESRGRVNSSEIFCDVCSQYIDGAVAKAAGRSYHISCFKCEGCHALLSSAFVIFEERNYCIPCGNRKERETHPECCKCKKSIEGLYKKLPDGSTICTDCSPQDVCTECNTPISGKYIDFHGERFHKDCFSCQVCKMELNEGVFTDETGAGRYCRSCRTKQAAKEPG
mmetsp:Transcript_49718/g.105866  ORF Transcript_49718/g.105866 Transcript_49718/m.105866 type:complete len:683 (+) Transcript_49718:330-2378(+)